MKKHTKKICELYIAAVLVLISAISYAVQDISNNNLQSQTVNYLKCIDGDTAHFEINGIDTTVRFLAIDAPETKHPTKGVEPYGPEASDYTCDAIKNATQIKLEYESSNETDKYFRTLAWVFVDGKLLQELLINEGLAKVDYIYGDYAYTDDLLIAQTLAQEEKRGIWNYDE